MPELPEVETTVRGLNAKVRGLEIVDSWTNYNSPFHKENSNIKNPKFFSIFKKQIKEKKILRAERRAKNILIHIEGGRTILIHMKMTGHILYGSYLYNKKENAWQATENGPLQDPFNQFIRFVLVLSNKKHLVLSDMRKFAKVTLLDTSTLTEAIELKHLGPEPLSRDFTVKEFSQRILRKPLGNIKSVLMNQTVISGIGNIYSDEILWASGIHPESKPKNLSSSHIKKMFQNTQTILKQGIDFNGDSMSDYRTIDGTPGAFQHHHNAYRRTNKPCTKRGCKGVIQRKIIGERSAHFCSVHQKRY